MQSGQQKIMIFITKTTIYNKQGIYKCYALFFLNWCHENKRNYTLTLLTTLAVRKKCVLIYKRLFSLFATCSSFIFFLIPMTLSQKPRLPKTCQHTWLCGMIDRQRKLLIGYKLFCVVYKALVCCRHVCVVRTPILVISVR